MFRKLSTLCALCLCTAAFAQTSFKNPIIPGTYPDPSICRSGDDYYLINSSFHYFPGVPIWHSRDLAHWERIGNVLDRPGQLPLDGAMRWGGIYAPTIRFNDGTYYMVTTNTTGGGNFFVTATDPRGPWSDPIWLEQGGIDPSFYFEDGHCYMVSNPDGCITLCEIDVTDGHTVTPSRPLWKGTGGRYPEGPHIYRKDGWYYLLISEGGTEYGHMVTIARSQSIEGPYESNPANPILTHRNCTGQSSPIQATGHADIVQATDGSWWMVCLGIRPQAGQNHLLGRETFLTPVSWPEGEWPTVGNNGTIALEMEAQFCAWHPFEEQPAKLDFTQMTAFGPEWRYVRNPDTSLFEFNSKGLTVKGAADGLDALTHSPSMVCRPQTDINFTAETRVKLKGKNDLDEAGLSVFLDAFKHYDICLCNGSDGHRIVVRCRLDQLNAAVASVDVPAGALYLRISGTGEEYTFSWSKNGKKYTELARLGTRYLSEEVQGGFTGCMLALYASSPKRAKAQFEYFSYLRE